MKKINKFLRGQVVNFLPSSISSKYLKGVICDITTNLVTYRTEYTIQQDSGKITIGVPENSIKPYEYTII